MELRDLIIILDFSVELGRATTEKAHSLSHPRLTRVELDVVDRSTNRKEEEDTAQDVMLIHRLPNWTALVLDKIVLVHCVYLGGLVF